MKSWWKQGKTGEKKPRLGHFRTTLLVVRNFRITHPLCENAYVAISKKTCSRSLPKVPCANFTGMRTLCELCANSFLGQIFKTMLSVWVLTGMRNFRITQDVMRNLHFLFKDCVLLFPCSISSSFLIAHLFQSPNPFLKFLFFIIPHSQHHHGSPSP